MLPSGLHCAKIRAAPATSNHNASRRIFDTICRAATLPRRVTAHVLQGDIDRLALNDLSTTEWARVRRHLFECDACLHRLLAVEVPVATTDLTAAPIGAPPRQPRPRVRAYVY
jgi:hypothetical protein